MGLIFVLSSVPSSDMDRNVIEFALRKVAHFAEYALLAALLWRALRSRVDSGVALRAAFALAVGYAVSDEVHQSFVDGRISSPVDVLIDAAGAATALALIARGRAASRA
jgi:VanZ family protein